MAAYRSMDSGSGSEDEDGGFSSTSSSAYY
jgi:hypothetical protein